MMTSAAGFLAVQSYGAVSLAAPALSTPKIASIQSLHQQAQQAPFDYDAVDEQLERDQGNDFYGEAFWVGASEADALLRPGVLMTWEEDGLDGGNAQAAPAPDSEEELEIALSAAWQLPPPDQMRRGARLPSRDGGVLSLKAARSRAVGGTGSGQAAGAPRGPGRPRLLPPAAANALASLGMWPTSVSSSSAAADEPPTAAKASKMLRCSTCTKHYKNLYSLEHHICQPRLALPARRGAGAEVRTDTVDGVRYYFCGVCNKPFKWLGNLTRHSYVHTGQRFYKCELCDKEFFTAYQVRRHMNSHLGVRYKCELCDKPFTCKYACAWHTKQHYAYAE